MHVTLCIEWYLLFTTGTEWNVRNTEWKQIWALLKSLVHFHLEFVHIYRTFYSISVIFRAVQKRLQIECWEYRIQIETWDLRTWCACCTVIYANEVFYYCLAMLYALFSTTNIDHTYIRDEIDFPQLSSQY